MVKKNKKSRFLLALLVYISIFFFLLIISMVIDTTYDAKKLFSACIAAYVIKRRSEMPLQFLFYI